MRLRRGAPFLALLLGLGCANTIDASGSTGATGTSGGTSGGCLPGSACDPCGDASTVGQVLGPYSDLPGALAVDSTGLYWVSLSEGSSDGTTNQIALEGGAPVVLAHSVAPNDLALDADAVYVADFHDGVLKIPKTGGAPTVLSDFASASVPTTLAVDESGVYWMNSVGTNEQASTIVKVPKAGGAATTLVEDQPALFGGMALDSTSVYWGGFAGPLMKVSKQGGPPELLAATSIPITRVAVDESDVYYTLFDTDVQTQSAVMRVSKAGGETATLVTGKVFELALDATFVYWSESDETKGTIRRMPKEGGAPVTIVCRPHGIAYFAVDQGFVYWFDPVAKVTMRSPKP